jgi:hypothetical protein
MSCFLGGEERRTAASTLQRATTTNEKYEWEKNKSSPLRGDLYGNLFLAHHLLIFLGTVNVGLLWSVTEFPWPMFDTFRAGAKRFTAV